MVPLPSFHVLITELNNRLFNNTSVDLYNRLNQARDWFNQFSILNRPDGYPFEFYIEDVWNEYEEGTTCFEYIIRSLVTKDETAPLALDVYLNHQDAKGVWHLGDYQRSTLLIRDISSVAQFLKANTG